MNGTLEQIERHLNDIAAEMARLNDNLEKSEPTVDADAVVEVLRALDEIEIKS